MGKVINMSRFIKSIAAGAIASNILAQGIAPANAQTPEAPGASATAVSRATMTELRNSCTFYSNLLNYADQRHFSGRTTTSQKEMAEGALQGILTQIYTSKFTGPGALPESQVTFTDPAKREKIQSMTIGSTTINVTPAPGAMRSYSEHCAYLEQFILPLSRETGVGILRLFEYAVNGVFQASRDPHTSYMWSEQADNMRAQTRGEFGGLGIEVSTKNGYVHIITPIQDTPAARGGLQANDLITAVNGETTLNKPLDTVVDAMRGTPGTPVTLTIKRGNEEPFDVNLTREIIRIQAVKGNLVGNNNDTAHIVIKAFSEKTTSDLLNTIDRLAREAEQRGGKLTTAFVDVRNNPGGLLEQAKAVSDYFLVAERARISERIHQIEGEQAQVLRPVSAYVDIMPENSSRQRRVSTISLLRDPAAYGAPANIADILKEGATADVISALDRFKTLESERDSLALRLQSVSEETMLAVGKTNQDEKTYVDTVISRNFPGTKIIVIQNQGSASASEIVAGALGDTGIEIVGRTSFGKGSVQTLFPIDSNGQYNWYAPIGSLRLTTGAFFPGRSGLSNQGSGIVATVEVRYNDVRDERAAHARREAELEHALVSQSQTRASQTPALTCTLKEEFAGALSPEELASVPKELVTELFLKNETTGEQEPVKALDADLACALNLQTGSSPYTVITPYTPIPKPGR